MSQTSYPQYQDPAIAGQKADIGNDDVVSANADDAALDGHFLTLGAGEGKCKQPAAAADITNVQKALGVAVRSLAREMEIGNTDPAQYKAGAMVPVMKKGRLWVVVEDAITVGTSTVNVRYAGTGNKGAFLGAAVAMETAVLDGAKWIKGTSGAGLALLELSL
jgi:hypothetical protein